MVLAGPGTFYSRSLHLDELEILTILYFQCGRQLRGDPGDEGDAVRGGEGGVEAARHLPQLMRDGRRIFSI